MRTHSLNINFLLLALLLTSCFAPLPKEQRCTETDRLGSRAQSYLCQPYKDKLTGKTLGWKQGAATLNENGTVTINYDIRHVAKPFRLPKGGVVSAPYVMTYALYELVSYGVVDANNLDAVIGSGFAEKLLKEFLIEKRTGKIQSIKDFKPLNQYCDCYQDGCYVYEYSREYNKETQKYETNEHPHSVLITDCLFRRGYYNLDPEGEILWDSKYSESGKDDSYNIYYKYAVDVVEAVQYVLLHEYYHFLGASNEDMAHNYARRTMIELRKEKKWDSGSFEKLTYTAPSKAESMTDKNYSITHEGTAPNSDDLPKGME